MKPSKGLILAAGLGRRISGLTGAPSKTLLRLHGAELFLYPLLNMYIHGIRRIIIVANPITYDSIHHIALEIAGRLGLDLQVELNPYQLGENGNSLIIGLKSAVKHYGVGPLLVSMSDHIHHPGIYDDILSVEHRGDIMACGDPSPFLVDVEEATKIMGRHGTISRIGKELDDYCCIDTGLFIVWSPRRIIDIFDESTPSLRLIDILMRGEVEATYTLCKGKPWVDIDVLEDLDPSRIKPIAMEILGMAGFQSG